MKSLRRLTAIVLNVFLLQVSLPGYWACGPDSMAMASAMDGSAGTSHEGSASPQAEGACLDLSIDDDCGHPGAPGVCAALIGCAAPALPTGTHVPAEATPPRDAAARDLVMVRQSPRPAPDLPPPRA